MQICCIGYCDFVDKHGEQTTDLKSMCRFLGYRMLLRNTSQLTSILVLSDLKYNSNLGATQVLRNTVGVGGVRFSGKVLRMCTF